MRYFEVIYIYNGVPSKYCVDEKEINDFVKYQITKITKITQEDYENFHYPGRKAIQEALDAKG